MDDLNDRNLMTIFNSLNENLFEDHSSQPFEYLLAKSFCHQILKSKVLFHRISEVYEVNTTLDQIFSIIRSLQLFEWSEISSDKQIANVFQYCINNGLGDSFLANKLEGLFESKTLNENDEEQENDDSNPESSNDEDEDLEAKNLNDQDTKTLNISINQKKSSISPEMIETEEFLQSPVNNEVKLTLSKKLVSLSSYKKSLQNNEFSESEGEDSEEADIVGELPNKYGMNSPKSPIIESELIKSDSKKEIHKEETPENRDLNNIGSPGLHRETIYDQTNTSFKITLQKSQSMSLMKHRKSSIPENGENVLGGKEIETLDVKTFMPIQDFCAFGIADLLKNMIEKSKKKKKNKEKLIENIENRNLLIVFDFNMLDVKNEEELVKFQIFLLYYIIFYF